ncbi:MULTISPECIES: lipocalin-like domain-containing protein [Pseudomonas]|uniref:lipocalin-like domain-containing protein n=1 Tax=Pseudomonas TaxID=286 RepID=UPI00249A7A51|nr:MULTISPECIES: lipocalin-like domain-containing protein [Pseudomonas]
MSPPSIRLAAAALLLGAASSLAAGVPNKVAGTWNLIAATVENDGVTSYPYGPEPQGRLVFTPDLYFVEFLHDPRIPRFQSNERGGGTDAENRAVMAGSLALYGRYTVDALGNFSGNTVEGSSFPNWTGDVRTTRELRMEVEGERMIERFQRPGGAKVSLVFQRAR